MHRLQQMQVKAKESCMKSFRQLHSFLMVLSNNDLKVTRIEGGFERAFATLFDQDFQTFKATKLLNLDQLEKHLAKEEFQELESFNAFRRKVASSKALDVGLIGTECSETKSDKQDTSSRSRNDTHAEDVDIKPVNDKEPMVEVQLTAQHNVLANEQQHSVQSEPIYDTHLLKKVDRNTTPDSINICHRGGEIDQNAKNTFQRFWRHASHTELLDQETESFSWQRFGEDVSQLHRAIALLLSRYRGILLN
uniref:Uncharacterized protein n=1 Tax=Tanacetum cinerariifolium TaxID=118510 RepID=A0A6L2JKJ2_TANCI|nr:hypothetical protein [Tanacetum cinerariifolium]